MEITTTYDANGARTDTIKLTDEEKKAVNDAVEIIKTRCVEAGYPEDYKNWDDEQWRLLGIMRSEGGIEAVLKFAKTAEILPFKEERLKRSYA